jgi:hypothetical protein
LGSVEGLPSGHLEAMEAGQTAHQHHGQGVKASLMLRRLAYALLALALALLLVTLALT